MNGLDRITRNPDVMGGKPCVRGMRVTVGTVVGLVEVMKCFSQISYGGPGLPERGTVVKALIDESAEVRFGQTLLLVKPS